MERRLISIAAAPVAMELRDGKTPVIVGYGSVFYDGSPGTEYRVWPDLWERIMPGAFNNAITANDIVGCFNHDPNNVLGRTSAGTMNLSVDAKGLVYEIEPGDTSIGRDMVEHLKRKDVTGSSFAFDVMKQSWADEKQPDGSMVQIRQIEAVKLYEMGPVTFPAYAAATADVRSKVLASRPQKTMTPSLDVVRARLRLLELL